MSETNRTDATRRHWRTRLFLAPDDASSLLDEAKLDRASAWVAGGFAALAGVLAFLGVREGLLDRMLRSAPSAALFVFALLGAGILGGLLAPALLARKRLWLGWPLGLLAVVLLLTKALLPDVGESGVTTRQVIFGVAFALAGLLLARVPISLMAGVLTLAVAFTATGLYAAAQLSVGSKLFTGQPQVTATVEERGDVDSLAVSVAMDHAETVSRDVQVYGIAGSTESAVGRAVLAPDDLGSVDAHLTFPVTSTDWSGLSVRICNHGVACAVEHEVLWLAGGRTTDAPRAGGAFARAADGTVTATLTGSGARHGDVALVRLLQTRADSRSTTHVATVPASRSGALTWSLALPNAAGDQLQLSYRMCATDCAKELGQLTGLTVVAAMGR